MNQFIEELGVTTAVGEAVGLRDVVKVGATVVNIDGADVETMLGALVTLLALPINCT